MGGAERCHHLGTRLRIERIEARFGICYGRELTGVIGGTGQRGAIKCGHRLEGRRETEGTGGGKKVRGCSRRWRKEARVEEFGEVGGSEGVVVRLFEAPFS